MFCQPIGREVSSVEIKMGLIMGGKPAVAGTIEVKAGDWVEPGQTLLNTETGKGNRHASTVTFYFKIRYDAAL